MPSKKQTPSNLAAKDGEDSDSDESSDSVVTKPKVGHPISTSSSSEENDDGDEVDEDGDIEMADTHTSNGKSIYL